METQVYNKFGDLSTTSTTQLLAAVPAILTWDSTYSLNSIEIRNSPKCYITQHGICIHSTNQRSESLSAVAEMQQQSSDMITDYHSGEHALLFERRICHLWSLTKSWNISKASNFKIMICMKPVRLQTKQPRLAFKLFLFDKWGLCWWNSKEMLYLTASDDLYLIEWLGILKPHRHTRWSVARWPGGVVIVHRIYNQEVPGSNPSLTDVIPVSTKFTHDCSMSTQPSHPSRNQCCTWTTSSPEPGNTQHKLV